MRGIRAVIPQPADQIAKRKHRGRSGGRPSAFDKTAYRQPLDYDKTATGYLAALHRSGTEQRCPSARPDPDGRP
ncbi:hypothetical protein ACFZAV_40675 [Streptomyces sp. NPDC008343]|uniref:hypothetical protein n=1 Tax=Streptomyces sp. NPDC008343 TaxID=3364828 RepID=UPI0036EF70D4